MQKMRRLQHLERFRNEGYRGSSRRCLLLRWSQSYPRCNDGLAPRKTEAQSCPGASMSIHFYGSCPLCRLIFRVFPSFEQEDRRSSSVYYLRPFPSYDRQASCLKETDGKQKMQYAIHFAVETEETARGNVLDHFADPAQQMMPRVVDSFSLSDRNPASTRKALGARATRRTVDFSLLEQWLQRCSNSHGVSCQQTWSNELLTTSMIDVLTRQIVQCPRTCEYLALSYVWVNVQPEKDALENQTLPQTIEDAITVAKQLGKQYLWVQHT
jgi:hypothetical protein